MFALPQNIVSSQPCALQHAHLSPQCSPSMFVRRFGCQYLLKGWSSPTTAGDCIVLTLQCTSLPTTG